MLVQKTKFQNLRSIINRWHHQAVPLLRHVHKSVLLKLLYAENGADYLKFYIINLTFVKSQRVVWTGRTAGIRAMRNDYNILIIKYLRVKSLGRSRHG